MSYTKFTVPELVEKASKEGYPINNETAGIILDYLEGHDYELGMDEQGNVVRNDRSYDSTGEHWESYSIREAILFAGEENGALIAEAEADNDRIVLAVLKDQAQALNGLYLAAMKVK